MRPDSNFAETAQRAFFKVLPVLIRVLRYFFITLAVLLAVLLILSVFRISIPLGFLRPKIESAASQVLGRDFKVEKSPRIIIGFKPEFLIEGCSVSNPEGWNGRSGEHFARLDRCFVKLGLIPLLRDQLRIDKLEIIGLEVNLERTPEGDVSWDFDPAADAPSKKTESGKKAKAQSGFKFLELRELEVKNIAVQSFEGRGERQLALAIESIEGTASREENVSLELKGTMFDEPLAGTLKGDSLKSFLEDDHVAWPYAFEGMFAGATLKIEGAVASSDHEEAGHHQFEIDAAELDRLERITGPLPKLGPVRLAGKFLSTTEGISLPDLAGNVGETSVKGMLVINLKKKTPSVNGSLELGVLDVAIFDRPGASEPDAEEPAETEEPPRKDQAKSEKLIPFTGNLRLTIAEFVNPEASVKDLELGLQITENSLMAGVSVEFAEAPLKGTLEIEKDDREQNPVKLRLNLDARKADIGGLVTFYTGKTGFRGIFEHLNFDIKGTGESLGEAWRHRQTGLEVTDAGLTFTGKDKTLEFQLDRGFIDGAWNRESLMGAEGVFMGEKFALKFNRLKPDKATADRPPFLEFTGTTSGATWRLAGKTRRSEEDPKLPLELEVSGGSLGELHNWLGIPVEAELPFALKGAILFVGGWHLNLEHAQLGRTTLAGELGSSSRDGRSSFLAELAIESLDPGELGLLFHDNPKPDDDPGLDLDVPILPSNLDIDNADIDLKIDQIILEGDKITGLAFSAEMRDGWLKEAPFQASYGKTNFSGTAGFDFRKKVPEAALELKAASVDIGALLARLGLVKGMEATAGEFALSAHTRGSTPRELLLESDLDARLTDALWMLRDKNTGKKTSFAIKKGSIGGKRGEETVVALDGTLSGEVVKLEIRTDAIDALVREDEKARLSFAAQFAESQFGLEGEATLPIDQMDFDAQLSVSGKRLSDLSELLKADLPPIGPYSLKGNVKTGGEGYSFNNFEILVGETDLTGNVVFNTKGKRPRLKADLLTKRFQMSDFQTKSWSPRTGSEGAKRTMADQIVALDQSVSSLLSAKLLASLDAEISLKADDVRSGKDPLGAGSLKLVVNSGRLILSPVTLSIPGGDFSAYYMWYPRSRDYDSVVRLSTHGFDYGVLARQKDPNSDMKGQLFIDMELTNNGSPLSEFGLDHASGKINFEMCPERLKAGIFDFWGSNLLFAVMPKIDPKNESKINCVIANFNITDGMMKPEALGIDTTRVRVISDGFLDFKNNKIDLTLIPKSKRPQILKVGLKIGVKGKVDDFKIDTGPMPILRSLAGMAGSTVLFPGKLLFKERIPIDGSDVCRCGKQ